MADDASNTRVPLAVDAEAERSQKLKSARKTWLTRFAILVILVGGGYFAWSHFIKVDSVKTDNAYVGAELASVTPFVSGVVTEITVSDTDNVKQGDVLVRLDDTDARIAVAQAEADIAVAQRRFLQTQARNGALDGQVSARRADILQARASLTSAETSLTKAKSEYDRRTALEDSGAVSTEEVEIAENAVESAEARVAQARAAVTQAEASLNAALGELSSNQALVEGATVETDPSVLAAKARLESAMLDLERTIVRAPVDGVVAQRRVQLGQRISQGAPIMTIVPLADVYVDANFKEGQLRRVREGMPAIVKADLYGGKVLYHGRVSGLSGATGSAMALIPAQNASGNWIKVVQRLPVRIELDPDELAEHPLRVGLSTEVEIELGTE